MSLSTGVVDPCLVNNGGCSDFCTKTNFGRICSCNPGHSLDTDGVTCRGTTIRVLPFRNLAVYGVLSKCI